MRGTRPRSRRLPGGSSTPRLRAGRGVVASALHVPGFAPGRLGARPGPGEMELGADRQEGRRGKPMGRPLLRVELRSALSSCERLDGPTLALTALHQAIVSGDRSGIRGRLRLD